MQFGSCVQLNAWEWQVFASKALQGMGQSGVSRDGGGKGGRGTRRGREQSKR